MAVVRFYVGQNDGYHATTVPMIVKASDSSTGSFYFYFRNKEDVFAAALEDFDQKIATALNEAIARAGSDPARQMKAAVERFVTFLAENPHEARILIVESSSLGPKLEVVRRRIFESHARSVEQAIVRLRPSLAQSRAALMARCWIGSVYESVYHWLEQTGPRRTSATFVAETVAEFNLARHRRAVIRPNAATQRNPL
jgi:AcrR family transcriptional regulator